MECRRAELQTAHQQALRARPPAMTAGFSRFPSAAECELFWSGVFPPPFSSPGRKSKQAVCRPAGCLPTTLSQELEAKRTEFYELTPGNVVWGAPVGKNCLPRSHRPYLALECWVMGGGKKKASQSRRDVAQPLQPQALPCRGSCHPAGRWRRSQLWPSDTQRSWRRRGCGQGPAHPSQTVCPTAIFF